MHALASRRRLPPARQILGGGVRPITNPNPQRVNQRLASELQGQLMDLGQMLRLARTTARNRKLQGPHRSPQGPLASTEAGPNSPLRLQAGIGIQNKMLTVNQSRGQSAGM